MIKSDIQICALALGVPWNAEKPFAKTWMLFRNPETSFRFGGSSITLNSKTGFRLLHKGKAYVKMIPL